MICCIVGLLLLQYDLIWFMVVDVDVIAAAAAATIYISSLVRAAAHGRCFAVFASSTRLFSHVYCSPPGGITRITASPVSRYYFCDCCCPFPTMMEGRCLAEC
jgi:hypothetical protein